MKAKYKRLADELGDRVAALRKRLDALQEKQNQFAFEAENRIEITVHIDDFADEQNTLYIEINELERHIDAAYADVPFAATAQKGVDAFWREVGGEL